MPTIAEQFLKTEQAANAILDELMSLKTETQNYNAASSALDTSSRTLSELAVEAQNLAAGVHEVVQTLKEIGTPRLLEGLENLTTRCSEQANNLRSIEQRLHELVDGTITTRSAFETAIQAVKSDLNMVGTAVERQLHGVEELVNQSVSQMASTREALETTMGTLRSGLQAQGTTLQHGLEYIGTNTARLDRWVRFASWAAVAAFACNLTTLLYLLLFRGGR